MTDQTTHVEDLADTMTCGDARCATEGCQRAAGERDEWCPPPPADTSQPTIPDRPLTREDWRELVAAFQRSEAAYKAEIERLRAALDAIEGAAAAEGCGPVLDIIEETAKA